MKNYEEYLNRVIKMYGVDLTPLKEIDRQNLFAAIKTVLTNIGELQYAEKLKNKIQEHTTIYEIAAEIRDTINEYKEL